MLAGRGQCQQTRVAVGVFRAVAGDEQHRRRVRGVEQAEQQRRAVDITPLQVVDEHDQRRGFAEPVEQRCQRREGAPAQLSQVRDLGAPRARGLNVVDALKDWKNSRECRDVPRDQLRELG